MQIAVAIEWFSGLFKAVQTDLKNLKCPEGHGIAVNRDTFRYIAGKRAPRSSGGLLSVLSPLGVNEP